MGLSQSHMPGGNYHAINHQVATTNYNIGAIPQTGYHQISPIANLGALSSPGATNSRSNQLSTVRTSPASSLPPSSIGGGISPSLFNTNTFPVSNNLMIGDYVTPGNLVMASHHVISKPQ